MFGVLSRPFWILKSDLPDTLITILALNSSIIEGVAIALGVRLSAQFLWGLPPKQLKLDLIWEITLA